MANTDQPPQDGAWQRIKAKFKPRYQESEPKSVTQPVLDTYNPETGRYMEIRYTRRDDD